ncbi:hypothetical protein JL722_14936 [Aureococcus anophagefferens]|nr:hypothetical protein JL722_14936 [Aureococcus anophagefferens]
MDMDVVSDALNHGALAAEAYRRLADEANRPPRCGVYVNGSAGLGRYAVAAHVYDAVDGKGAYYGDAPLRLAPRDLTVDGADRAFATPFHVDPDLDVSGLVKVVPTNNSLIISALGQILTELELSNVTFVFDESQEDWGGGWDDVDAYLLDSWGVVATKLTTEELVADVTVVDASHLLVVASYDPDSCEAEMDALDAGRLAPQAQLFVSCLDGLFAKEIVRGFAGQTERSYEVDAWHDRVEAVDGLTGESAGTLLDRLGTSYDLDWDPLSSETAVYALAAFNAGDCQGDGTCACRDGFSGDECAVKNCAPGSYHGPVRSSSRDATSASHCICEMGTCEGKHCFQPLGEDGVASKCDFTECAEPIAGTGAYCLRRPSSTAR